MGQWEPNARGRLEQAAMELFLERGFEQTTVAEIAARAGLTERTFFRHYADKREVLFWGQGALRELMVSAVAGAPDAAAPFDAARARRRRPRRQPDRRGRDGPSSGWRSSVGSTSPASQTCRGSSGSRSRSSRP